MLMLPELLIEAAQEAGMKTPEDCNNFDFDTYPHFCIFCKVQLGIPVTWGNHWDNAKIIAKIPQEKLQTLTYEDLLNLGFNP